MDRGLRHRAEQGHVFYRALNRLFQRHGFEAFVEGLVERAGIFANGVGRPSVAIPGVSDSKERDARPPSQLMTSRDAPCH